MSGIMEELNEKVRRETLIESVINFANKLISQGKLTLEEIAAICSLSLEEVKALAAKQSATEASV